MYRHPNNHRDFLLSDDEYIVRMGKKHYERPKSRHWQAEAYVDEFNDIDDYRDEYAHDFGDEDYFEFVDDEVDAEN